MFLTLLTRLSPLVSRWLPLGAVLTALALVASILYYKSVVRDLNDSLLANRLYLAQCHATIESYKQTQVQLEAELQAGLKKAEEIRQQTTETVRELRTKPLDNTLPAIREEGLKTAREASKLWQQ